ncbi:MAG: S-layer homology domain-containing protein, partial [Actinomycetota bacterium]
TDIDPTDWAYADIACIHDLAITTGTTPTTYSPDDPVTRRQMAAFLARLWTSGDQPCETWTNPFGDLDTDGYAFDAVSCLWLLGITNGTSPSTYGPDQAVTRRQMAAFLGRILHAEPDPTTAEAILAELGWTDPADINARLHLSMVGAEPDGPGNPEGLCGDGKLQTMGFDPYCGYVDVGCWCVEEINRWRAQEGLEPFVRAPEHDACTAREARLAAEAGQPHYSDDCGWRSQASAGGGRGGDDSPGTVKRSVEWLPYLIYREGPGGGHYEAMMSEEVRAVSCSYYAIDRDTHRTFINYYDLPD